MVAGILALLRQSCGECPCGVRGREPVRFGPVSEGVRSNTALHRTPPMPCPVRHYAPYLQVLRVSYAVRWLASGLA